MEKQESIGFIEFCLRVLNSDLKHFKFFSVFVAIPTIVAFVLVMWVIDPMYAATAVVTPPASKQSMSSALSGMMGGSGMSSLLGLSMDNGDANAVWTILNSWELHDKVIEKFDLAKHYKFKGKFHADLLKEFRRNFGIDYNKEDMFSLFYKDTDAKRAVQVIEFMLEKADSAFNVFKTNQARQSRLYFQGRLDSCEHVLDSVLNSFVDFQVKNNVYEPGVQLSATIKYLSELQAMREEMGMELDFEKLDRGENSKRYQELQKRVKGMNAALGGALKGKHSNIGMIELKKSPELYAEYLRRESEIRIQETLYKLLRQQSEQMRLEEAKMLKNLHVLEPPWENNKKIYPLRAVTLIFVFAVACLLATIVCNIRDYLETEEKRGTAVAREWVTFKGFFKKNKV
ncbi:Capsule polysaccharide export protein KpsE/RkpR [Fibrobacter sp. UWB16]|uniref:lipopolysaccharide biosynthesis protein n=1 Tax=Fibrobacter sp. UWB16 TaxID=1945874 RepID=UPI000BD7D3A6|nr:lipopolysaccharide biosynthesis protein [Fibrobacter sp. UWB16]SOD17513.1 Capsule polysaccharide export protein KpsE/RkpR [Fibrobacter sp. UWB16]